MITIHDSLHYNFNFDFYLKTSDRSFLDPSSHIFYRVINNSKSIIRLRLFILFYFILFYFIFFFSPMTLVDSCIVKCKSFSYFSFLFFFFFCAIIFIFRLFFFFKYRPSNKSTTLFHFKLFLLF